MECICCYREVFKAFEEFEQEFKDKFSVSVKEALVMCSIEKNNSTAGEIAKFSYMKVSQTSKIIKSVEDRGFISRNIDSNDKRVMTFTLTSAGRDLLKKLESVEHDMPEIMQAILKNKLSQ